MATKEQLRKLRQKHHLGEYKHHLGEYRNKKRKIYKHHSIRNTMARRKRSHYSRKGSSMKGVWGQILGVGLYVLFEQYLEPMVPISEPILSIAEFGISYWISKKSGIVGDVGKAGVYINMYQLLKYFAGTTLPNLGIGAKSSNLTQMFAY